MWVGDCLRFLLDVTSQRTCHVAWHRELGRDGRSEGHWQPRAGSAGTGWAGWCPAAGPAQGKERAQQEGADGPGREVLGGCWGQWGHTGDTRAGGMLPTWMSVSCAALSYYVKNRLWHKYQLILCWRYANKVLSDRVFIKHVSGVLWLALVQRPQWWLQTDNLGPSLWIKP